MTGFARFQVDTGESLQLFHGTRNAGMRISDVKFGDFGTFALTGVSDVKGDLHWLIQISLRGGNGNILVGESCVRKSIAEGEQRLDDRFVVAAVAHKNSFGVL